MRNSGRNDYSVVCLSGIFLFLALCCGAAWADDPDAPVISSARVLTTNRISGSEVPSLWGRYQLVVDDPNGTVPDTLSGITVTGPGGTVCTFDLFGDHWNSTSNGVDFVHVFRHITGTLPVDGAEYTFTVTDTEGKSSGVTVDYTAASYTLPLPDSNTYQPTENEIVTSTTPTLNWAPVSFSGGTVYYGPWIILDWSERKSFGVRTSECSYTVPEGILEDGKEYWWGVSAHDALHTSSEKTRSEGDTGSLMIDTTYSGTTETYLFDFMWPTLKQPWYMSPNDVAISKDGDIYIADVWGSNKIKKFNQNGQLVDIVPKYWTGHPGAVDVDHEGNVYVVDITDNHIYKLDESGGFIMRWGDPGSGEGQFDFCVIGTSVIGGDIAVDGSGDVYVADTRNHRIQKFSSEGAFITQWGSLGSGDMEFDRPAAIACDKTGHVYVVDVGNKRVQKFDGTGVLVGSWDAVGFQFSIDGGITRPGITVGRDGRVYVSDPANHRVDVFNPDGLFLFEIGGFGMSEDGKFNQGNAGLVVDEQGNVYVADRLNHQLQKFSDDGEFLIRWGCTSNQEGRFNQQEDIALDTDGYIYVADKNNSRIQKFDHDGYFLSSWSGDGPESVCAFQNAFVYTANGWTNTIHKYEPDGSLLLSWGEQGSGPGQLQDPHDIAVDSGGSVYVLDLENHCVQKYNADGEFDFQWGVEGTGDGEFSFYNGDIRSGGIAIDADDYVYVADLANSRIQKFTSDGQFVLWWGEWGYAPWELSQPMAVAVDETGDILVADAGRIKRFTPGGDFVCAIAENGTAPGQLAFMTYGLDVGDDGRIYVADTGSGRVQVFKKETTGANPRAIVVAGGGPYAGNNLWDATQMSANFAYRTLTYQGFTKETITYLSSDTDLDLDGNGEPDDVDGDATNANLQAALTSGVTDADSVLLYLVDHGDAGQFRMSGTETLSAADLDAWLDTLQGSVNGEVTVVYDACHSGSFLSPLSGASRTVITSTSPGETAKFVTQGSVSFSNYFWTHVFNGESVGDAFDLSEQALAASFDDQTPLLDANANGVGNETADYDEVASRYIGNGTEILGDAPVIGSVSAPQTISGTTSAVLAASGVTDPDGIARVWAVIRPPDFSGGGSGNPVLELPSVDLMPQGGDTYEMTCFDFNAAGTYQIAVYALDRMGNTCIPELTTVSVEDPLQRKAVIVAGGPETDDLWPAVEKSALQAYEALKGQGYADTDIYFLSPVTFSAGVDGTPVWSNVQYALRTWAPASCQDVVVYLMGRGGYGKFELSDEETLLATELDTWLDELQGVIPGKVTLIYDASYAGSFLSLLTPPAGKERIVIASTGGEQEATFAANGDLSFTKYFWKHVLNGMDVRDAFVLAKNAIFYANGQRAQLDDNGDGIVSKPDGQVSDGYTIGMGILLAGDAPVIGSICSGSTLYGSGSTPVWVEGVTTTGTIDRVWAVVSSPMASGVTTQLPSFDLTDQGGGRYEGSVSGLTAYGWHGIAVYAMDTDGEVSMPAETYVWQEEGPDPYEDDDTLGEAGTIAVDAVDAQRHNFHDFGDADWVAFSGVSGQAYEIKTENLGSSCDSGISLYNAQGVLLAWRDDYFEGDDELLSWSCEENGVYYVEVTPYDPAQYGSDTGYDLRVYTPTGGPPGLLQVMVLDAFGNLLAGASLSSSLLGYFGQTLGSGSWLGSVTSGSHTVTVEADGYAPASKGVTVASDGEPPFLCFVLTPSGVPVVIGDLDGDGDVDGADAALAQQVIAGRGPGGIRPDYASSGADVNGDGRIGVEELVYIREVLSGVRTP